MKNKLLIVFNTCGISGNEKVDHYISCIENILNQDFDSFDVVVSSCLNNQTTRTKLIERFGNRIFYNWIDEILTVNITFNHTVQKCVEARGNYEAYVYIDSGINFENDTQILSNFYKLFKSGPYCMVAGQADNDNAYIGNLGTESETLSEDTIIPVGKACNLHAQLFSNEIYEAYNNRIIPDIFASFCTESVFSFLCAAIKKQWVISKDIRLAHAKSIDGPSSGFLSKPDFHPWDHTAPQTQRTMTQIISQMDAIDCGFGYEECQGILMHNPSQFDENHFCINNDLVGFINKNVFLSGNEFDYNNIKYIFTEKQKCSI